MRPLAIAAALIALATLARAEELILSVAGLPAGATASAVSGIENPAPATRDGDTLTWRSLAPGAYSVEIRVGSTDVIGVDMRIRDAAGKATEPGALDADAEAAVRGIFAHTEDFFSVRRIALLAGTADAAVALIESRQEGSATTNPQARGKTIFRLDLWDFHKSNGSWSKVKSRTILRRTIDSSEFSGTTFIYARELGGVEIAPGQSRRCEFTFPSSPSGDKEKK